MYPIPRWKPIDKLTAPGSLSFTEGNAPPRREARKPDIHSSLLNKQASPEKAKRAGFPRKDSNTVIKTLRFKKSPSKAVSGPQTYAPSSPLPSSSSSSASFTADRGESAIAQALNRAVANNNRSSVDTDVLMSNADEHRPVPKHTGPAEKIDDVNAELIDLRRQLTELQTTVFRNTTSAIQVGDHGSSFINC